MSFLEKLKKNMEAEIKEEAIIEDRLENEKEKTEKLIKKEKIQKSSKEKEALKTEELGQIKKIKIEEMNSEIKISSLAPLLKQEKWPEPEGQLAIDVYQTPTSLIIQTAIAGVKVEDLDISIEKDILTIRGIRQRPYEEKGDYFIQECYWGPFSRKLVMPLEVEPDGAQATMKDGILTIRIPKLLREKKRQIKIKT